MIGLSGPLVAVLAYDGLCTFEFGVAYEVFGLPRPEMGADWYHYSVCGVEPGPLRAGGGLAVTPDHGLEVLDRADLIVAPGWRAIDASVPVELCDGLQRASARGARVMSLCSGVAVLAASGLLKGRRATTHWRYLPGMIARYPEVEFIDNVLYVDEGQVLTAAGSAAGIDLCLHVVRRDFGHDAANAVARRLVVPPHRSGGQAQFVPAPVPRAYESDRLAPLLEWMRANLDQAIFIEALADRAGMSRRTFQRRFSDITGLPPGDWLIGERVRRASELMEAGHGGSVDAIAAAVGFQTGQILREHFKKRLGVPPATYRASFAARA